MKNTLGKVVKTQRGFEMIIFDDYNRETCSLQASSLAIYQEPGTSAVWLGCEKNVIGEKLSTRMHLTDSQVKALVFHLQNWLDSGSFIHPKERRDEKDELG